MDDMTRVLMCALLAAALMTAQTTRVPTGATTPYIQSGGGSRTTGNCTKWDQDGKLVDAGTPCGNTNGFVSTSGSYEDPTWITSLSWSKLINVPTFDSLPSQAGNNGKYLTTNGTAASWGTVNALPSQSGNGGRFLTTDGTSASWAAQAATTDATITTSDITTNNASTSKHGFAPKLAGDSSLFLNGLGAWAAPPSGTGGSQGYSSTVTSSRVTIGTGVSAIGASTFTRSGSTYADSPVGTGTVRVYLDSGLTLRYGYDSGVTGLTCSSVSECVSSVTSFPTDSIPLYSCAVVTSAFTACTSVIPGVRRDIVEAGTGMAVTTSSGKTTVAVTSAVVMVTSGTSVPGSCTSVNQVFVKTDNASGQKLYYCNGSTYEQIQSGSSGGAMVYKAAACQAGAAALSSNISTANAPSAACVTGTNRVYGVAQFTATGQYVEDAIQLSSTTVTLDTWTRRNATGGSATATLSHACVASGEDLDTAYYGSPQTLTFSDAGSANFAVKTSTSVTLNGACASGERLMWADHGRRYCI
jgi:hypothetical protein